MSVGPTPPASISSGGVEISVSTWTTHLLLFVCVGMVAATHPVTAEIAHDVDGGVLNFLRFSLAAIIFLPLVRLRYGLSRPSPQLLAEAALLSLSFTGFFVAQVEALRYTSALNTSALHTTVPGLAALYAVFLVKEHPRWYQIAALVVAMLGALWVIFRGELQRALALDIGYGDLIFFAGCCLMALFPPLVKRFHRGESMAVLTFWMIVMSSIWMLLYCWPQLDAVQWTTIDTRVWTGIVFLAAIPTFLGPLFIQYGAVRLGPTRASAYLYLTPAFVLLFDVTLGRGWPSYKTCLGVIIVMGAIVIVQHGAAVQAGSAPGPRNPNGVGE